MFSVVKTRERELVRELRREGRSVREIERLVGVSRSSVSRWIRDIALTPEQIEALRLRDPRFTAHRDGSVANARKARARRAEFQERGREIARNASADYTAGCMLWWAEGSRARCVVQLTNSDPDMLRVFVQFLRTYFDVADDKVRVQCNLFADHGERQREIEQFWLDTLALPSTCLTKSMINHYSRYSQKKRQNKLPYGTCRLTVCSTEIAQILYGSIQELGGFERPEWLDL